MDYKELIRQLRDTSNCDILDYVDDASDAIETLLKQKEALIAEIKGRCEYCAFDSRTCVNCYNGSNWEWRGVKDETSLV